MSFAEPENLQELIERLDWLAVHDTSKPEQWFAGQKPEYKKHADALRKMVALEA